MDKTILVGPDIAEGAKFIQALERSGMRVRGALWQRNEDAESWRLEIVTPLVDEIGLRGTFQKLNQAVNDASDPVGIDLDWVSPKSPKSDHYKLLRRIFRNKPMTHPHWLATSYIYFVR